MKKQTIVLVAALFISLQSIGQVTYAKPAEYDNIFKRVLAIELLEENSKVLNALKKDEKKNPGSVASYQLFIKQYNETIQKVATKYWTLNEKIEFITTSELEKIQKSKNTKYVCLYYTESKERVDYTEPMVYRSPLSIPTYNYNRAENSKVRVDYSFFMPVKLNEKNSINEFDIIFSLQFIQLNIREIQKSGKKIGAKEFAEDQASLHCSELEKKTLLIDKSLLHKKATKSGIKENYSYPFKIVTPEEIDQSVTSSNSDEVYTVAIPTALASGSVSFVSASRVLAIRLLVDAKSGLVYGCIGTKMGEFNDANYRDSDFKKFISCK